MVEQAVLIPNVVAHALHLQEPSPSSSTYCQASLRRFRQGFFGTGEQEAPSISLVKFKHFLETFCFIYQSLNTVARVSPCNVLRTGVSVRIGPLSVPTPSRSGKLRSVNDPAR